MKHLLFILGDDYRGDCRRDKEGVGLVTIGNPWPVGLGAKIECTTYFMYEAIKFDFIKFIFPDFLSIKNPLSRPL